MAKGVLKGHALQMGFQSYVTLNKCQQAALHAAPRNLGTPTERDNRGTHLLRARQEGCLPYRRKVHFGERMSSHYQRLKEPCILYLQRHYLKTIPILIL
jgi:hypothetical protein